MMFILTGTSILTDSIFYAYGGTQGTSTPEQRQIAYAIAEQGAVEEIGTFLTPVTLTGTFLWPYPGPRIQLPYSHVTRINGVTALHEAYCDCTFIEMTGSCAHLVDGPNGVIDLRECAFSSVYSGSGCGCGCAVRTTGRPYQARIAFTAGHEQATVLANSKALMGLVTAADLALEQIVCGGSQSEGGPGDPSVSSFSDTGYSMNYQFLRMTALGGSARANYAARMLRTLKHYGPLRIG